MNDARGYSFHTKASRHSTGPRVRMSHTAPPGGYTGWSALRFEELHERSNDQRNLRPLIWLPATYRIRVDGHLHSGWSELLQGMSVSVGTDEQHAAVTELSGVLPDQAALMGVLVQLYDYGIPLLALECTVAEECGGIQEETMARAIVKSLGKK